MWVGALYFYYFLYFRYVLSIMEKIAAEERLGREVSRHPKMELETWMMKLDSPAI